MEHRDAESRQHRAYVRLVALLAIEAKEAQRRPRQAGLRPRDLHVALVIGGGHDQDALGGAGGGERLEQGVCRAICGIELF